MTKIHFIVFRIIVGWPSSCSVDLMRLSYSNKFLLQAIAIRHSQLLPFILSSSFNFYGRVQPV